MSFARPSLPTSSSDFALPTTPSSAPHPTLSSDDLSPFMARRLRRPSLLSSRAGIATTSDSQMHSTSPLATSFIVSRRHSVSVSMNGEESESDRDKMSTDSDSGNATPLLPRARADDGDTNMKNRPRTSPRLPPIAGSSSSSSMSMDDTPVRAHVRRLSHPVKMPRILTLVAESHLQDDEVKSEAQFQRMVASFSESPTQPRTPRAPSDRGRHPEETGGDESQREDTPSDDDDLDLDDTVPFAYVDPLYKPITPAQSVNGDEMSMTESPGMAMDVDLPSSMMSSPIVSSWRYTPPPTSSAVRNNKRKFDDRYDPYPNASKRRAVSPSISILRDLRENRDPQLLASRISNGTPRLTMPIPIPIASSGISSGASSPVIPSSSSYFGSRSLGSASILSSPTMRTPIGLASPVLRPILRAKKEDEREVEGAGEAVNGLSLV